MATAALSPHPQNLEAEEYVLGAMMLSEHAIVAVQETGLRASDFYRHSHGGIYQAACDMNDAGQPVDVLTLLHELHKRGDTQTTHERLQDIASCVPAATNAAHHAQIVRDMSSVRALGVAGETITRIANERLGSTEDLIEQSEEALRKAVDTASTTRAASSLAEAMQEIGLDIKHATDTGVPRRGLATGFTCLDDGTLTGLWEGQLICLAARPGLGKSTLAQNIAENIAGRNETALLVSLEMSKKELSVRSLARASKVDGRAIQSGLLTPEQAAKVRAAWPSVTARAVYLPVQDDGNISITTIKAEARRLKRTANLGLVVVDYVQLLVRDPLNVTNELGSISRGLKMLARDLNIPIIMISQLNRGVENRQEKRPTLADLRDSGALEQDSDVVMFLFNAAAYDSTISAEDAGKYEVIIAKNRRGMTGTEYLDFTGRYLSFNSRLTSSVPS